MKQRKLIVYISMTLDGFLSTKDDDISFLSTLESTGEDYGYHEFTASVDTYIVGRKTYSKVVSMVGHLPQAKQFDCYIITRQDIKDKDGVTFYNGDIEVLIENLKKKEGGNIYCDGGGEIVKLLMEKNLIDEYIISVIPLILGDGKRLFIGGTPGIDLKALPAKSYQSGLVQLHYKRIKN